MVLGVSSLALIVSFTACHSPYIVSLCIVFAVEVQNMWSPICCGAPVLCVLCLVVLIRVGNWDPQGVFLHLNIPVQ